MTLLTVYDDNYYMKLALREAKIAFEAEEVPIGAVLVYENQIISKSHNQTELLSDVTAHAEILAITSASSHCTVERLAVIVSLITKGRLVLESTPFLIILTLA